MPYINSTVTVKLSEDKKEFIKTEMGKIISEIPGKSEKWLMIELDDEKTLYFRGTKLEKGAFINVKIFGEADRIYKEKAAQLLFDLFEQQLEISKENMYITFNEIADWAWNGGMF